ncbi:hypothetical protein PDESU_05284 [Pontiella desulfatans]|uniref:Uncharacterized protein n=1 Tax=Pontiella desulfatans TaxID=2750659 RepID=A0A6C2UA12_PONDE|nr:hypothetical protein [Pontiella desulfatans]VGO16693.1 hypothetical protein PDESU_05284 [Pontiella desulfatans]
MEESVDTQIEVEPVEFRRMSSIAWGDLNKGLPKHWDDMTPAEHSEFRIRMMVLVCGSVVREYGFDDKTYVMSVVTRIIVLHGFVLQHMPEERGVFNDGPESSILHIALIEAAATCPVIIGADKHYAFEQDTLLSIAAKIRANKNAAATRMPPVGRAL